MKKIITILKRLLYFFGGYIIFTIIVALIEFIFRSKRKEYWVLFSSMWLNVFKRWSKYWKMELKWPN